MTAEVARKDLEMCKALKFIIGLPPGNAFEGWGLTEKHLPILEREEQRCLAVLRSA